MKYLKKFQTNADYQAFKSSNDWITPNVSKIENNTIFYKSNKPLVLISFTIGGYEYQAEEGMTFYDWAMSEYYDSNSLSLLTLVGYDLRDGIIQKNVSPGDALDIIFGAGGPVIPSINTDTIIQPISYIADVGGYA